MHLMELKNKNHCGKMIEGYIHFGNNVVEKHINEEIEKIR